MMHEYWLRLRALFEHVITKTLDTEWEQKTALFLVAIVGACSLLYVGIFMSPWGFPDEEGGVSVREGMGIKEVGDELKDRLIIRSSIVFQSIIILMGGERKAKFGDYAFTHRQNAIEVA